MIARRPPFGAPARRPLPLSPSARAVRPAGLAEALYVPPPGVPQVRLTRPEVAMFQQVLIALGYTDNGRMRVDGVLGPITARAVHAFQTDMQPARIRAESGDFGDRARAFLAATAPLRVDGDLGPETQRWLRWFALPADQGGAGGEGADYSHVPVAAGVTGLVPARVARSGGRTVAAEVSGGANSPPATLATIPFLFVPPSTTTTPPPASPPSIAPGPTSTAAPPPSTTTTPPPPSVPGTTVPVAVTPPVVAAPPRPLTTASATGASSQAAVIVAVVAVVGLGAWAIARPADRSRRENPRRGRRGR